MLLGMSKQLVYVFPGFYNNETMSSNNLPIFFFFLFPCPQPNQSTTSCRVKICLKIGAQFLLNSYRTKHMSMAKLDIKVGTKICLEDSCVRYAIIYTNG